MLKPYFNDAAFDETMPPHLSVRAQILERTQGSQILPVLGLSDE